MGAGPAGLTAAYELFKHDIPVTILEKDANQVGGLARTVEHNGYRFDIGGHRFFSKNQEVEDLWTEILGSERLTSVDKQNVNENNDLHMSVPTVPTCPTVFK